MLGAARALAVGVAMIWAANLLNGQQWTTSGNDIYNSNTGNVGIGITSPGYKFSVSGQGYFVSGVANQLIADTAATSQQALLGFFSAGSQKWQIGKDPSDSFMLWDQTASRNDMYIAAGGNMILMPSGGNVGIGTTDPPSLLSVNGTVQAKEVLVNAGWSDYVFKPDYNLVPLREVAVFIRTHQHLPDIPSEAEVQEKGVSLGEMQAKLLAKIEELTLHMIEAEERNNRLATQNGKLQERIARLETVELGSQKQ